MTIRFTLFFTLSFLASIALGAAEQYDCHRIADGGQEGYRIVANETAELAIDGDKITSRIRIEAVNKDATFASCATLPDDGSNFSRWFVAECRKLKSADGGTLWFEPFLYGAYAGISPVIDRNYILYDKLAEVARQVGIAMPVRTFIIYAETKPQYEFFCQRRE